MTGSVWLASYPKSGNTWMRWFIASYLAGGKPLSINAALPTVSPSSRAIIDYWLGVDTSELSESEISALKPVALRRFVNSASGTTYFKVHEARSQVFGYTDAVVDGGFRVILVVRDPRDVALSYANHLATSLDSAIDLLCHPRHGYFFGGLGISGSLEYLIGDWTSHTRSWLETSPSPLLVRYEDMKADPFTTFRSVVEFLELPYEEDRLRGAIRSTSFEAAKREEESSGFDEALPGREFFKSGAVGKWCDVLTADQVQRIRKAHGPMMMALGYGD